MTTDKEPMIPYEFFVAFMELQAWSSGAPDIETIAKALGACGDVDELDRWLALSKMIASRADERGFARGRAAAPVAIGSSVSVDRAAELEIIRTYRGTRGTSAMPDCVREYIREQFILGETQTRLMAQFGIAHGSIIKIKAEALGVSEEPSLAERIADRKAGEAEAFFAENGSMPTHFVREKL